MAYPITKVLVKPENPDAFLVSIGAKMYAPYGIFFGLVFEFSDGTVRHLSKAGDGNRDPYMGGTWVKFPEGCDEIQYIRSNYSSCDNFALKSLLVKKLGVVLPSIDGRTDLTWMGNENGIISVNPGYLIGSILMQICSDGYWFSYKPIQAYGVKDPNAKPMDGGWSDWSIPTICSNTCGPGITIKKRECNNPPTALGGKECEGPSIETESCNLGPCPINGNWSEWSSWSNCEGNCNNGGTGVMTRNRSCNNPAPQNGGKSCIGDNIEINTCKLNSCVIDGNWSNWSDWSVCNNGMQERTRQCNNPDPQNGGKNCIGSPIEKKICPVDGNWSEWSDWSVCNDTLQERKRTCNNPVPQNGGKNCIGFPIEKKNCAVDGNWSKWTDWSVCNNGFQERMRSCDNPIAKYGGKECEGNYIEKKECELPIMDNLNQEDNTNIKDNPNINIPSDTSTLLDNILNNMSNTDKLPVINTISNTMSNTTEKNANEYLLYMIVLVFLGVIIYLMFSYNILSKITGGDGNMDFDINYGGNLSV